MVKSCKLIHVGNFVDSLNENFLEKYRTLYIWLKKLKLCATSANLSLSQNLLVKCL